MYVSNSIGIDIGAAVAVATTVAVVVVIATKQYPFCHLLLKDSDPEETGIAGDGGGWTMRILRCGSPTGIPTEQYYRSEGRVAPRTKTCLPR